MGDLEGSDVPSRRRVLSAIATAGAAGLAGCSLEEDEEDEQDPFTATPVVLGPEGQEVMNLTEFAIEERIETVTPSEERGEVETTSYLAVHSRAGDHEPPMRFDVPDPATRTVGLLSMPSPEGVGQAVNPLASEPLEELLVGGHGRQLLAETGAVESTDFDWRREPTEIGTQEVEFLETETEARSFLGIAVGEGRPTTVLATLSRIQYGGNTVLIGEFDRRQTPDDTLADVDSCTDALCQIKDPELAERLEKLKVALEDVLDCKEVPVNGRIVEVCSAPGGGGDSSPSPKFGISNVRFVQQVDATTVEPPGGSAVYTEGKPDLVDDEITTILFEFDQLENLDQRNDPLEITMYRDEKYARPGFNEQESFEIPVSELKKIASGNEHTITVLHRLANDGSRDNNLPLFRFDSRKAVVSASNVLRHDFWEQVTAQKADVADLDPLKVGFVMLADKENSSRFGDSNGLPRAFLRSFESATEYLQRVYPGRVVSFGYTDRAVVGREENTGLFVNNCTGNCVVYRDMKHAKDYLNRTATDSSYPPGAKGFPNGGRLHLDGVDRSSMVSEIRSNGFDVVVAIVPGVATNTSGVSDYYDYHGIGASGLAYEDPAAAVSSEGTWAGGNDQIVSMTVAQEIGHHFQDDYRDPTQNAPMAQRRDPGNGKTFVTGSGVRTDPAHARHQNSTDASGNNDPPGVVSLGFDLVDGFACVEQFNNPNGSFSAIGPDKGSSSIDKIESYMSYTNSQSKTWADARIHQQLIDSGWSPSGTSGSGKARYMLSAVGGFTEEGTVRYGEVTAMPGVDEYTDLEEGPVRVELLAPDGEVLETARVDAEIQPSHHDGTHEAEPVRLASFSLPFADRGVRVRTTYDDVPAVMNPITRSVRDGVRRVPEEGIRGESAEAVEAVGEPLEEVADAMEEEAYAEAAAIVDGEVRERIEELVREYEAALNQPTLPDLLGLVDEMVRRLQVVAETAG